MATKLYMPSPTALLPRPRFQAPKIPAAAIALNSGLNAVVGVANNLAEKRRSVEAAGKMADALEREGMSSEANLYREAAGAFSTNFFSSPEENSNFNRTVLADSLKLLTGKQEREIREQQLAAEAEYRKQMSADRAESNRIRMEEAKMRGADRADAIEQRSLGNKKSLLDGQERGYQEQLDDVEKRQELLQKRYQSGSMSRDEFENQFKSTEQERFSIMRGIQDVRQSRAGLLGGDASIYKNTFTPRPIPEISTQPEIFANALRALTPEERERLSSASFGGAQASFRQEPVTMQTNVQKVDAQGNQTNTTITKGPAGSGGPMVDPTAPGAKPSIKF